MQRVRVMVICSGRVLRGGVASILNSAENLEVVGREGADVLQEAYKLQPDLIVFDVGFPESSEYDLLKKLKDMCGWTKIIVFTVCPLKAESIKKLLGICDGYLQGPILPGFLLKAVELACYSGYFFFLGPSKDFRPELKKEVQHLLPLKFPGSS